MANNKTKGEQMVTQFNSVCLNRRRDDNRFLGYNTERSYERIVLGVQHKFFVIETSLFLRKQKLNKCSYMN